MPEAINKKNEILAAIREKTNEGTPIKKIKVLIENSSMNLFKQGKSEDHKNARNDYNGESEEILDSLKRILNCDVEIVADGALGENWFKVVKINETTVCTKTNYPK